MLVLLVRFGDEAVEAEVLGRRRLDGDALLLTDDGDVGMQVDHPAVEGRIRLALLGRQRAADRLLGQGGATGR